MATPTLPLYDDILRDLEARLAGCSRSAAFRSFADARNSLYARMLADLEAELLTGNYHERVSNACRLVIGGRRAEQELERYFDSLTDI